MAVLQALRTSHFNRRRSTIRRPKITASAVRNAVSQLESPDSGDIDWARQDSKSGDIPKENGTTNSCAADSMSKRDRERLIADLNDIIDGMTDDQLADLVDRLNRL